MPFRFRRRFGLPGLHVNVSRGGLSLTAGVPGFRVTVGKQPALNVGILGSGISYRESLGRAAPHAPVPPSARHVHVPWLWLSLIAVVALWLILGAFTQVSSIPFARR